MRVAMLEMYPEDPMATGQRGRAMAGFLRRQGHAVDILAPDPARLRDFSRFRFSLWSRLKRRVSSRATLPHLWEYVADDLEARVRAGGYDAVIGRAYPVSYVLTRPLRCRKLVDVASVAYLELFYSGGSDAAEVEATYRMEQAVYRAADVVLLPHESQVAFFRRYVHDHDKVMSVKLGCDAAEATAEYSPEPRIVYAGSYYYFQDPLLMARLVPLSPYPIDFYGRSDPNRPFLPAPLAYRGYEPSLRFLARYQIGLVTISADWLRRHSPVTKFPTYFAHGLPVLFPRWMQEGYEYPAAVPYDEQDFAEQARRLGSDEALWREKSRKALETAARLRWDDVLQPLLKALQG